MRLETVVNNCCEVRSIVCISHSNPLTNRIIERKMKQISVTAVHRSAIFDEQEFRVQLRRLDSILFEILMIGSIAGMVGARYTYPVSFSFHFDAPR